MNTIVDAVKKFRLTEPVSFANLTMVPLLGGTGVRPDYATLDEAIAEGWVEVREVSRSGSVPELTVVNNGDRAVLMLDGEELLGAKQNRVLNLTILVPAGKMIVVPVSCVEQGRWAERSPVMGCSGDTLYAAARLSKMMSVSGSYRESRRPVSDQLGLWRELANKSRQMEVQSETGAMSDIVEKHRRRLEEYEGAFCAVEGQTGAAFAIAGRLVGLESFEHPDVLRKMLPKIVRSYALDALQADEGTGLPAVEAERFLTRIADARSEVFPAVGHGQDVRITGAGLTGAALIAESRLVHLCAFQTEGGRSSAGRSRMLSASRRRQR